jgi:hypothetical protein
MSRFLRRMLCWLGVHELPPGVTHELSIVWACRCCGTLVNGRLGERRRR